MATQEQQDKNEISEWCKRIITGPAGFISYEDHEWPIWHVPREQAIAEWVIRCLANPADKGSEMVIDSIIERRKMTKKKS